MTNGEKITNSSEYCTSGYVQLVDNDPGTVKDVMGNDVYTDKMDNESMECLGDIGVIEQNHVVAETASTDRKFRRSKVKTTSPVVNRSQVSTSTVTESDSVTESTEDAVDESVEKDSPDVNLSMSDIDRLSKYIHVQGIKDSLNNEVDKVNGARQELLGSLTGLDCEKDFIQEKLDKFNTLDELKEYLVSDSNVENFYVNDETGDVIDISIDIDDKKRQLQFKRELLIYLKTTDIANAAIDREYEELEKATAEMDMSLKEACIQLSDNVLAYIAYLRTNADSCEDETTRKKIIESAKYIESGYTFEVLQEVLDEHPSVIKNTVNELIRQRDVDRIGKRYTDKLRRYNVNVSLIPLVSNGNDVRSVEEYVLIRDDEYKLPDLFMYSTIRYFAMADWDNENVKRFHASIALVIKRLISNDLDEEVKDRVITYMIKYLAQFEPFIK